MERLIAIGDIHGCLNTLKELMDKLNIDYDNDIVIFLGDYIDRGKFPVETALFIKDLVEKHPENVIALKGNHEDMCDKYYSLHDDCWCYNGNYVTRKGLYQLNHEDRTHLIDWMANLPIICQINEYTFCHSGYTFEETDKYGYDKRLWDRKWLQYGKNKDDDNTVVIFGHTPHEKITNYKNDICIDTGAVYESLCHLSACIITEDNNISTISIPTKILDIS